MAAEGDIEQVLARLLQAVPAGVVHLDSKGGIERANDAAAQFLGLSFDGLTQRYVADFAGKTYFEDGSECPVEAYPASLCLTTHEAQGPTTIGVAQPNGDIRWAIFTATPVEQSEGVGAVVTLVDITQRLEEEEARLQLERRLQLSDRLASVGSLAAGVVHEINNPLTYILGNLSLADEMLRPDQGELRSLLDDVRFGAQRVAQIAADLGRLSSIFDTTDPVDVARAADAAAALARPELKHRASLEMEFPELPLVRSQMGKLVQAVLNLLLRATRGLRDGAKEAHAIEVTGSFDGSLVHVDITDVESTPMTGQFAPIFTTDGDSGLSICRGLASEMAAALQQTTSESGRPVVRLSFEAVTVEPAATTEISEAPTRRLRILVVDDEPEILHLVEAFLSEHDVHTAHSGRKALDRLDDGLWDLVLCDLMMSDLTGVDVHDHIEQKYPSLAPRLVFMTGGAFTDRARAFMSQAKRPVLPKPFGSRELRALIAHHT